MFSGISWGCLDVIPTPGTQDLCVTEQKWEMMDQFLFFNNILPISEVTSPRKSVTAALIFVITLGTCRSPISLY